MQDRSNPVSIRFILFSAHNITAVIIIVGVVVIVWLSLCVETQTRVGGVLIGGHVLTLNNVVFEHAHFVEVLLIVYGFTAALTKDVSCSVRVTFYGIFNLVDIFRRVFFRYLIDDTWRALLDHLTLTRIFHALQPAIVLTLEVLL